MWIANGTSSNLSEQTVQVGNLVDFAERSRAIEQVGGFYAFYGPGDIRLVGAGEPQRLTGVPVTAGFFPLLGVEPFLGQGFEGGAVEGEETPVLLGHRLWREQFGASEQALGARVQLDGGPAVVVGVLPDSFDFAATFTPGRRADFFTHFPLSDANHRRGNTLALIGRLAPGTTLAEAQAEATAVAERLETESVRERRNDFEPRLTSLHQRVSGDFRLALFILLGAVGVLMLIVCANLSNLLLARARTRRREMAVRVALGAGRARLLRQLLIESLVLSAVGATLGLVLASIGTGLLAQIEGTEVPLLQQVRIDPSAMGFTLLLTLATGILFGLAPALQASAATPAHALRENSRGATAGRGGRLARSSLVAAEIALTCVLLTAVGLLVRSLGEVLDVELGFTTENVMALRIDPSDGAFEPDEELAYVDRLLGVARNLPGVEAASLTDALPLGDNFGWRTWDASTPSSGDTVFPLIRIVGEDYLEALEIPLLSGRFFTHADATSEERVAVVNPALARALWPGEEPLGKTLRTSGHDYCVVGVVSEARYFALERASGPELYLPIRHAWAYNTLDLVVRSSVPPSTLAPELRRALRGVDPELPTADLVTMEQLVDRSTFSRRSVVSLLAGFAGFGLVLASLGVYAVIAYSVSQRRKELGVRMAFGAGRGALQRGVMIETARPALLGLAAGLASSFLVARGLEGLLYGVASTDPLTYVGVILVLALATLLASWIPARRTARLDVTEALRAD